MRTRLLALLMSLFYGLFGAGAATDTAAAPEPTTPPVEIVETAAPTEAPAPAEELISADKAKSIALNHAGLSASDVTGLRAEYDVDDGVKEFDVEFRTGDYEYDYTINAVTGKVIKSDKEYDPEKKPVETKPVETEPPATEAPVEELISADKAKSIALDHAGLSEADVTGLWAEYDVDDGVKEFEVEFRAGDYEYDYTINAVTGKVIKSDKEYDPEKKPVETKPVETEPAATEPPATEPPATEAPAEEKISASKAKSIARKHAGVSSKKVKGMECEYDVDDGVKLYEIEFRSGKYEYSYEINALTGEIISWEKEIDD